MMADYNENMNQAMNDIASAMSEGKFDLATSYLLMLVAAQQRQIISLLDSIDSSNSAILDQLHRMD